MSQHTAIAIPTRAGIGGAPTTRTAVNAAITPAPIVSMMCRDRVNGVMFGRIICYAVFCLGVC
jgi:hypothetical protein